MTKKLDELNGLADTHRRDTRFTPASKIATTVQYRNRKGERIGMPPNPELDMDEFSNVVMAGVNPREIDGPLTGFGNFLVQQGHSNEVYAGKTTLPEGEVAEQDLYDEGTPGKGTEIDDDSFESLKSTAMQLAARRAVGQWQRDLKVLEARFASILKQAQVCENRKDFDKAALWDNKAVALARTIDTLRSKIASRVAYERIAAEPVEKDEYEEVPTGMAGSDNLKDELGLEQ